MKKFLTSVLFAIMLAVFVPAGVYAANATSSGGDNGSVVSGEIYVVNPLYEDVISLEDAKAALQAIREENAKKAAAAAKSGKLSAQSADSDTPLTDHNAMAKVLRDGMKNRETEIVYTVFEPDKSIVSEGEISEEWLEEHTYGIYDLAVEHTGVPNEGDYLQWQNGYYYASASGKGSSAGYTFTITFTIVYYTTASEEEAVNAKVSSILSNLNVPESASAYEKVQAVYDYLCENVTYDYEHLGNDSYTTQFTAYGALNNGTSVCQGYAVAFYRLALELGVDNRVITGTSQNQNHAWNIARIGSRYYNLDSTWDSSFAQQQSDYQYFLKTENDFAGHTRGSDYSSSEFNEAYPMATSAFVPCGDTHT
ncbi:MAG: hypothetical protein HUJ76_08350, partial [Parasporobacterium sp.]|nr:hypothetical protein [Parasporobacterium sp.]